MEKEGIILNFKEDLDSLSGILTAYIKKSPGMPGSAEEQAKILSDIINVCGIDTTKWRVKHFKLTPNAWGVTMKQKRFNAYSNSKDQSVMEKSEKSKESKFSKHESNKKDITKNYEADSKSWAEQAYNYQLKIEITFEPVPMEQNILEAYKEIVKDIPKINKDIITKNFSNRPKRTGIAAEMATVDAHLGKLAWEKETGYRNYDLNIAIEDYKYVYEKGLNLINPYKPEIIIDIIGNDMYHMDNMEGKTTHGEHTLDVDGRITKVHHKVFQIKRDNIIMARKIAPVKVIWIPGNHDFLASYMLCYALMQYFKGDSKVTFDIGENAKKAMLWGNLLVGWNHAIKSKYSVWINELPQQFPNLWGKSKLREWHVGDQHKKANTVLKTPINTVGGVTIRQFTALSPVDRWHTDNAFTDAVPGGDVLLWDKQIGVFANYTLWTGQYEDCRNKIVKS